MIGNDYIPQTIMFAHERQQRVIDLLKERSSVLVTELEALLGASAATVRRDLGLLEESGKIRRTHGGVHAPDSGDGEISFDRKSRHELRAKRAIAAVAAGLVRERDTVFVDAGSTAFKVGAALLGRKDVTIFTNSIPLLEEAPDAGCRVVALGGEVRAVSRALIGSESLEWMRRIRFDVAFVGASGIDPKRGPCTTELGEAGVKRAAVQSARRSVLVADGSKWSHPAAIVFADWQDLDDVITDHKASPAESRIFSTYNVRLHKVRR